MEKRISDLLESVQDDSVDFEIKQVVSPERIKEITMKKIAQTEKKQNRRRPRGLFLAAVVAAALLLCGFAAAKYTLANLRGPEWQGSSSQPAVSTFSLVGLSGTPEYEAVREWETQLRAWEEAGENQPAGGYQQGDMYARNQAYSETAQQALDALLEKYDLTLHDSFVIVESPEKLYSEANQTAFLPPRGDSGEYPEGGTLYNDGSLHFNGVAAMEDGKQILYQFYSTAKGVFSRTGWLLEGDRDFTQWMYTTAEGEEVLLAISADKSLLAANLDYCFVFVNILTGTENQRESSHSFGMETVDSTDLEAFADAFDFGIIDRLAEAQR